MNNEKNLIENIISDIWCYQTSTLKKGKTIVIHVIDKGKDWTQRETVKFRSTKAAIKYLEKKPGKKK